MNQMTLNKPGSLVTYRDRDWMVLPSADSDVLLLKPLGGAEEETTGVYLPLRIPGEEIKEAHFPLPTADNLGAFETAKLLFDAARLSFRNASGPFRCMGKLSFRPRAYQMVPLTMALKQDVVRLLIADDVGIGKTIEALVIIKELLERAEIKRFAVICPPHLCEQWQSELKDKLDIEAEIIRSSTAASLDRRLPDDRSVFYHVPYQVISIDYIKSDRRRGIFLNDCPELVIVDEAHTCALPQGAKSKTQQQRHALIYDAAQNTERHILLLTATPHSGKDSEFISLLGLLDKSFRSLDFSILSQAQRKKIAKYFILRRRSNIKRWMQETTTFPERDSKEIGYRLSPDYNSFYDNVLRFARGISQTGVTRKTARIRYWTALALLRGVMSSPAAGLEMLKRRQEKQVQKLDAEELDDLQQQSNPNIEDQFSLVDEGPAFLVDNTDFEKQERDDLADLSKQIENLFSLEQDVKAAAALKWIKQWLKEGFQPIIFCKYIATAKYLGEILRANLPKKVNVQVITSELADEQRKEQVELMGRSDNRVLVATDCLSEGINLQEHFTAVFHYDLPWNPNRIEQRDGRVDRFGQTAPLVKSYLLWGEDNPIDKIVLNVLTRKIRDIQNSIGTSIPLREEHESVMDEVLNEVLLKESSGGSQLELFAREQISNELEQARQKTENLRSIFAHETVKQETIEKDLREVDEAIGNVQTVENFIVQAATHLGAKVQKVAEGYEIYPQNLPPHLRGHFNGQLQERISFESPTPRGFRYIGRNHTFVEQLCQFMLAVAFEGHPEYQPVARVSEILTDSVSTKTTLVMFRVRNVIKEVASPREVIAEEMYLWGYEGEGNTLEYEKAWQLLTEAQSLADLSVERQKADLVRELEYFDSIQAEFIKLAADRAEKLVEAHSRFKELVGGRRFEKAVPVLPPDVMGVYILVPKPRAGLV